MLVVLLEELATAIVMIRRPDREAFVVPLARHARLKCSLLLARLLLRGNRVGLIEEEATIDAKLEVQARKILKIIAKADRRIEGRVPYPIVGANHLCGIVRSVAVRAALCKAEVGLQEVLAEVLTRSTTHTILHLGGLALHAKVVLDLRKATHMLQVGQSVARRGVVRSGIEIHLRLQRNSHARLEVEGARTVELPIGELRRSYGARRQGGLQREGRDRVVDLGSQLRRIGHIGGNGQLRRLLERRLIGLRHLDLLLDLRPKERGGNKRPQQQI